MSRIIQVDYGAVEATATQFGQQADQVRRLAAYIHQGVDALQCGGWEGVAAQAFINEMECDIFPALNRLSSALEASKTHALTTRDRFRATEEQAGRYFISGGTLDILPGEGGVTARGAYAGLPGGAAFSDYAGGLIELAKSFRIELPFKDISGPILGTILDAWTNPDNDWTTSIGSSVFQNVFKLHPWVAIGSGVSSVMQLFGRLGSAEAVWNIDMISPTPAVHSSLDVISGRLFGYADNVPNSGNWERLNLDNVLEPLGDIAYHSFVTPYNDANANAWDHPNVSSVGRALQVGMTGSTFIGPIINIMGSPSAQHGIATSARELLSGTGNILYGAVDYTASSLDYSMASGAANLMHSADYWPIPRSWERTIDSSAEWFIERIEHGMIPGVNIPILPLF
jgi:WXG100 family type VII secretion target